MANKTEAKPYLQEYAFPAHPGIVVKANNHKEAVVKLNAALKAKTEPAKEPAPEKEAGDKVTITKGGK